MFAHHIAEARVREFKFGPLASLSRVPQRIDLTQSFFVDLAGRCKGYRVEYDFVRNLPFGHLRCDVCEDVTGLNCCALMRLYDQQGSLFPFGMRDPDDSGDPDARTGYRNILDIDRTDPFAA